MNGIPTGEQYMASRRQGLEELFDRLDADNGPDMFADDTREELDELALSVVVERHVVIVLGTGGPHDELDVNLTTGQVVYGYYWGSEYFETNVSDTDPLFRYAEYVSEYLAVES